MWWMDHGISSMRAEVILRRKLMYLQEENDNAIAAAAAAAASSATDAVSSNIADIENYSSHDNGCVPRALNDELPDTSSTTMMHHRCIDNSHCEHGEEVNENSVVTSSSPKAAFLDDDNNNNINSVTESFSAIKPQSPTEDGINNNTNHLYDFKRRNDATLLNGGNDDDDGVVAHEISLDDTNNSIPLPHQSCTFDHQALIPSSQHDHSNKIPMVQLSRQTIKQQRTYLDFGEGNTVGKMTHQQFRIVAPSAEEGNDDSQEFHVQLTKCLSRRGIVCSTSSCLNTMEAHDSSTCDDTNIITFRMKRGESKTINVEWTPNNSGCMRETLDLDVTNSDGIHWQQSLVIVGEAHHAGDNDEEEEVLVTDDVVESNDLMVEKHVMISDITDTIVYSRDDLDDELSLEEDHHRQTVLDGMKVEDDSMEYSLETHNEVLPKRDDDANKDTLMLWNVNLSEIKEVGDNDTREELVPQSEIGCQFAQKVNEISVSLASGGGVVGHLAKIDETDAFTEFSTIPCLEPNNNAIQGDTTEMFHHFEEPREDGRPERTNGAPLAQHLAKNDETETFMEFSTIRSVEPSDDAFESDTTELFHHFGVLPEEPREDGRLEQTANEATTQKSVEDGVQSLPHQGGDRDHAGIISAVALEPKQETSFLFENWENEQLVAAEKRAKERLQSKQINDFEDLLRSEGLVETGETHTDVGTCDGQIEVVMDINSSLINFVENMRSKSPSFGSLSSKESLDDHNSLPSIQLDDQPRRASLISTCLAEAQDHLTHSPGDMSDDIDLLSQSDQPDDADEENEVSTCQLFLFAVLDNPSISPLFHA